MAVAAAEQTNYFIGQPEAEVPAIGIVPEAPERTEVYPVHGVEYEAFTQARFRHWLGSLASQEAVDTETTEETKTPADTNLLEMLHQANAGSSEARNMAAINVSTATAEACFKKDYVSPPVKTYRNENGERVQFGQTTRSVHRNAIIERPGRHPKLRQITEIEALNDHRIDDGLMAGKLKDHYLVVASIVPEGVPEAELGPDGDGYFLDSMSFALQATMEGNEEGETITESGFMAGVEAKEGDQFKDLLAKRYDIQVLAKVYERLGQKPPSTAAGFLNDGLYIPKDMLPNGVVDFMRWCAEAAADIEDCPVERSPESYAALREESRGLETSINHARQKVLNELLASADAHKTPIEAIRHMWQLVKKHTVKDSFRNTNIDPMVFGRTAALHIEQIRQHLENGTEELAKSLMHTALSTAVVSGCGGGAGSSHQSLERNGSGRDQFGSLKFTCPNGHINTRKPNELLPKCQHSGCKAKVTC